MIERGTVTKVKRGIAYVRIERGEKCEGCKLCAFNGKNKLVLPALCDISVSAGDTVSLQMPTRSAGAGALLVYALPLAALLVGAVIGLIIGGLVAQIVSCAVGLAVGIILLIPLERVYRRRAGVMPVVLSADVVAEAEQEQDIDA